MAKSSNQKRKLPVLEQILRRETDEDHPLTAEQLMELLRQQDIACERKSLYDDMETLRLCGLDVETVRIGRANGYYLGDREFQLPELRLLVDAVQSSRFITEKKSLELIRKLESLTSRHQAVGLQRQVHVLNRVKSMNESVYYIIDDLHRAIQEHKQIGFRYFDYDMDKNKRLRYGGSEYWASPCALIWDSENYYLAAYKPRWKGLRHFRVDKMEQVRLLDSDSLTGPQDMPDPAEYARRHFGMFNGQTQPVTMHFGPRMASIVMDRFGKDVRFVKDETGFSVTVEVDVSPQFYAWIFGLGDQARILGPIGVVEGMYKALSDAMRLYEPMDSSSS